MLMNCKNCGDEFSRYGKKLYCSPCKIEVKQLSHKKYNAERRYTKLKNFKPIAFCKYCGAKFIRVFAVGKSQRLHCSKSCSLNHAAGSLAVRECRLCGNFFQRWYNGKAVSKHLYFCSDDCYETHRNNEDNHYGLRRCLERRSRFVRSGGHIGKCAWCAKSFSRSFGNGGSMAIKHCSDECRIKRTSWMITNYQKIGIIACKEGLVAMPKVKTLSIGLTRKQLGILKSRKKSLYYQAVGRLMCEAGLAKLPTRKVKHV